jgi:hypothetical protein
MHASLIVAFGLPLTAVVVNALIRWSFGLPQSAAADMILVLIVFDISVVSVPGEILKAMPEDIRVCYGMIALACVALWIVSMNNVEAPLRARMTQDGRRFVDYPFGLTLAAFGLSGTAMIINLAPLVY